MARHITPVGVLVAVGSAPYEAELLTVADRGGLHVVRRCVDVADLLATAAARQAQLAVVSAQLRGLDATVVSRLRHEGVAVLGLTVEAASADEARLRELGVAAVVDAGQVPELEALADDVLDEERDATDAVRWAGAEVGDDEVGDDESAPRTDRGTVVAVWGPTGAPGRTTVACGLAAATSQLGRRTLLVDADVYGGTVAPMLGMLDESSGLLAAARAANHGELGPERLIRLARAVHPTLRVLTGLPRADRWVEVGSVLMRRILAAAAEISDVVVVDCGFCLESDEELSYDTAAPRRNGATIEALSVADIVLAVGSADPIGLSRLIRAVHDLRTAAPEVTPRVVVNRMRKGLGWSEREVADMIARATGREPSMLLPDDSVGCDRAVVHGRTLLEAAPESRLAKAVSAAAADLVGVAEPVRTRRAGRVR